MVRPSSLTVRRAEIWAEVKLDGSTMSQTRSSETCRLLVSRLVPSVSCPLGTIGAFNFVAFVAIEGSTWEATGDGGDNISPFFCLEAEAVTLALAADLFLDRAPLWVRTLLRLRKREKQRRDKALTWEAKMRENKMRVRTPLGLTNIGNFYKRKQLKRRWTIFKIVSLKDFKLKRKQPFPPKREPFKTYCNRYLACQTSQK